MDGRKYTVEFVVEVEAESETEAIEIAKDGVICDNADIYVNDVAV